MSDVPSPGASLVFSGKALLLRLKRGVQNLRETVPRHVTGTELPTLLAQIKTPLFTGGEPEMELGKVQNLRQIARLLDGIRIPAGETFSFWRQVGRCRRGRGFVHGREIRQGCLIPSVGGGICALTNSLYEAALKAGIEIVERHPHSRVVPGSAAERGMDATVSWNYLDLRLRSNDPWSISVRLTRDELIVSLRAEAPSIVGESERERRPLEMVGDCATCGIEGCFRHRQRPHAVESRTAYWMDEVWPEFTRYVSERDERDLLFAPMAGRPAYAWPEADRHATAVALRHAWRLRKLATQGAARQQAMLARAEALVERYTAMTPFDVDEIVLPLSLLPFAWRSGVLGGRRFRVLATRLPMAEVERRLDRALDRFPERALLGDFRAPADLVRAEREALQNADAVVTPHAEVAGLFGSRAVRLPWDEPSATWTQGSAIGFPGPVIGRKGAYEVREAARQLGLTVVTPGRDLEGKDFWGDVPVRRGSPLEAPSSWFSPPSWRIVPAPSCVPARRECPSLRRSHAGWKA